MHLSRITYLASYFLQAKMGRKKPILCGFKLTHRCTLQCRQCPYWQRPAEDMTFDKVKKILPELYQKGIRLLIMEGGEPFVWKDGTKSLEDVVLEARKYFYTVGITTNGTLPLETSADIIWVSIDGLKETHDNLRGISFDRIIENIKKSSHSKIFANITINRINYPELTSLVKYISPMVKGITIQFFFPYPESEDLALTWEQRRKALEELIVLKKEGYPVADSKAALEALKGNKWRCEPWMIANVEPDGTYNQGCYLKNRTPEDRPCNLCGFAAHTEISLAYQLNLEAIWSGRNILKIF